MNSSRSSHLRQQTTAKVRKVVRRKREPESPSEQDEILRAATIHLVRKHGGLLVATDLKAEHMNGSRRWIITVTLRYPTGHEGYIGDLLYDGEEFSFVTPPKVRKERMKKIAADPKGISEWHEYRASTLRAGKT